MCAVWYVQTRRLGGFLTASAAAAAAIAGLYAAVCLPGIVDGTGAFTAAQEGVRLLGEAVAAQLALLAGVPGYAESAAIAEQLFSSMYLAVPVLLTGVLCVLGALFGFFTAVLFFAFTRRRRAACGLAAPKPFRLWVIPRRYVPGIVLLYVMALVLRLSGFANADAVYNTVGSLLNLPLMVQGLSLVAFLLSLRSRPGKALSAVTYVLIGVLFPLTSSMLTTVGLFDLFLRFRDRVIPPAAPQRGE